MQQHDQMSLAEDELRHDIMETFCNSILSSTDALCRYTHRCSPHDLVSMATKEVASRAGVGTVAFLEPDDENCSLVQILLGSMQLAQETW